MFRIKISSFAQWIEFDSAPIIVTSKLAAQKGTIFFWAIDIGLALGQWLTPC
jgi:hypothetical protein